MKLRVAILEELQAGPSTSPAIAAKHNLLMPSVSAELQKMWKLGLIDRVQGPHSHARRWAYVYSLKA